VSSVSAYAGSVETAYDSSGGTVAWSNTSNAVGILGAQTLLNSQDCAVQCENMGWEMEVY
jgi:hypothetical protein